MAYPMLHVGDLHKYKMSVTLKGANLELIIVCEKKSPVLFTRQLFLLFWAQGLEPVAAFPFVLDQNRSPEQRLRFRAGLIVIAHDHVTFSRSVFSFFLVVARGP